MALEAANHSVWRSLMAHASRALGSTSKPVKALCSNLDPIVKRTASLTRISS